MVGVIGSAAHGGGGYVVIGLKRGCLPVFGVGRVDIISGARGSWQRRE